MLRAMSDTNPETKSAGDGAGAPAEPAEPTSSQAPAPSPTTNASADESNQGAPGNTPQAAAEVDPLGQARADMAAFKERYLRLAADFDNFRKRAKRDVEEAERRGKEGLLRDLLPVFDNLERAVVHASQATDAKAVADGVRMVLRQFTDTLERVGIKRVPTVGTAFDPNLHEAIQQIETPDQPPGTVVAEVQPGYTISEKLVRAAMVVVAKAPSNS
jgi:molecular chaperone GrpE